MRKALFEVEGRRIVDRQLDVLLPLFDEVVLVVAEAGGWDVPRARLVVDQQPGKGPLAGLEAVLSEGDAFVVGCDLPYLDEDLIRPLCAQAGTVVPRVDGVPQPLHARWAVEALPEIRRRLAAGELRVMRLIEALPVTYLDFPSQRGFTNLNFPT